MFEDEVAAFVEMGRVLQYGIGTTYQLFQRSLAVT